MKNNADIAPLAIGFVLLAIGGVCWLRHIRFFERAIKLPGRVVSYKSYIDDEGTTMYQAVVSYEFDGENCTVVNSVSTSWKPKIGKICQVGIDPRNLQDVRIYSKIPFAPGLVMALGLLFSFVGLLVLICEA